MHGRRRGQRDLRRDLGDVAQEGELVERQRLRAADLGGGVGRGELHLVAVVVAELEDGGLDGEAVGARDEARPIGAAAELAVGDDRKAALLLQSHHVADAVILDAGERRVVDAAGAMVLEGLLQARRPQQAADVVGPERGPAGAGGLGADLERAAEAVMIFYSSIDEARMAASKMQASSTMSMG